MAFFNYQKTDIVKPDYVICRTIYPLLTYTLEIAGTRVFNDHSVSGLCNNKCSTYAMVSKCGIPIMDTAFCGRTFFNEAALPGSDYPFILKSVDGHGGSEVYWINNGAEFRSAVKSLYPKDFLMQKICAASGKDLRVYVLGGRILSGVLRSSSDFRSNYSLGGKASRYELTDSDRHTVDTVVSAFPSVPDFIGIDFLYDDGRLIFNEIEDVVGTRMLYDASNINAAEVFCNYINDTMINLLK